MAAPEAASPRVVRASLDQRLHTYVQYNPDGAWPRPRGAGRQGCGVSRASPPPLHAGCARLVARAAQPRRRRALRGVDTARERREQRHFANPVWLRLTLRAADVRLFDMVRRDAAVQKQKLLELLQMLDIWNLRSFRGQKPRERAWNAATRMLPALTWLVKYDVHKQLLNDIAAGIAVSFLIVPQARRSAPLRTHAVLTALLVARRGCLMQAWRGCLPSRAFVRARSSASEPELRLTRLRTCADACVPCL